MGEAGLSGAEKAGLGLAGVLGLGAGLGLEIGAGLGGAGWIWAGISGSGLSGLGWAPGRNGIWKIKNIGLGLCWAGMNGVGMARRLRLKGKEAGQVWGLGKTGWSHAGKPLGLLCSGGAGLSGLCWAGSRWGPGLGWTGWARWKRGWAGVGRGWADRDPAG